MITHGTRSTIYVMVGCYTLDENGAILVEFWQSVVYCTTFSAAGHDKFIISMNTCISNLVDNHVMKPVKYRTLFNSNVAWNRHKVSAV